MFRIITSLTTKLGVIAEVWICMYLRGTIYFTGIQSFVFFYLRKFNNFLKDYFIKRISSDKHFHLLLHMSFPKWWVLYDTRKFAWPKIQIVCNQSLKVLFECHSPTLAITPQRYQFIFMQTSSIAGGFVTAGVYHTSIPWWISHLKHPSWFCRWRILWGQTKDVMNCTADEFPTGELLL